MSTNSKDSPVGVEMPSLREIERMSLLDLVLRVDASKRELIVQACAGKCSMPLAALLHGMPVAGGILAEEFALWHRELVQHEDSYQALGSSSLELCGIIPGEASFAEAAIDLRKAGLASDLRKLDYFRALHGNVVAAERLRVAYPDGDVRAAFLSSLVRHAKDARFKESKGRPFFYRAGVGVAILIDGVAGAADNAAADFAAIATASAWAEHRRRIQADARQEAVLEHQDSIAVGAIDDGREIVGEREERERQARPPFEVWWSAP